jgi:hypothetical protein
VVTTSNVLVLNVLVLHEGVTEQESAAVEEVTDAAMIVDVAP